MKIAVFISGSGSNLQSIIDHIERGLLAAEISLVVSNVPNAYGLWRAKEHGLATAVVEHGHFPDRESFERELVHLVQKSGAEYVVLAGFMRILSPFFLGQFSGRVVNIHPALLPSFPGLHAQKQQAQYGVRLGGCTVHFVDEKTDHGPILIQAAVPAYADDDEKTLGARILELEHRIYPQALQWLAQGRIRCNGRQVELQGRQEAAVTGDFLVNPPLEKPF